MTVEARQWRNTLRWSTNDNFFQTLGQQWALSPRDISCYLIPGFTPSTARFVHNNIISKDVCRVFVLRCQSASHLTCFVSFRQVHLSYAIIQSYKSHSFIHSIIHSYIKSMHTQHIHDINSYMVASVTQILFGRISSNQSLLIIVSKLQVPTNEQLVIITFIKSVIPSVSGQEMSLINHFKWQVRITGQLASYLLSFIIYQVASPNNRTTGISLLSVNHSKWPVRTTGQLASSLLLSSCFKWLVLNNGQLEFTFLSCSKPPVPNNGPLEFTFLSCFKLLVLNNGPLEFSFLSCFKPPVPNNRLLEFTFLSCFKPPVLNNGPLEFTFHHLPVFTLCQVAGSPYEQLANTFNFLKKSVIPSISGPEMSLIISPVDFGKFFTKPSGL